ncbi:MAG: helix-turn-helix domain-containing protein [Nocardioidaceae bacterium]
MTTVDGVDMVTVREAAELAERTPETIRRWVWSGRLPARRDGHRLLLDRQDVLHLVDSGTAAGASTLRDWARQVRRCFPAGERGSSARDLVIADRVSRGVGDAGR